MYIKEIKINGFKSFADNVNLELNRNFTGIVGPNGSGKSNIVDALKWVMGEQSVKTLRGSNNMSDVIFNGSNSREASRSAKVEIVLDNTDKSLPLDYTEIEIKRVLYKTGENEYFINKEKVRLKDITDLFLDSFSSKESLSIIPQGKISEILNVSYDEIYKHLSKKTSIERVHPEGRNLDSDIADKINNLNIDGVYLLKESKRNYIYKDLLSHVIGYTGIDNQGLSGLELKYDTILTGVNGSIKYYSDGKGNRLSLSEKYDTPINGQDIKLTIDLDIELALENELNLAMTKYNAEGAIGIVMDPNNGEILAMSSKPSFDPANYKNYTEEVINRNLAIWANFEPGSTFKIVTLAAAINENKVNLFEEHFYDTGGIKVENATLHCWKRKGHGDETFLQVVENSCNLYITKRTFFLIKI